MKTKQVKKPPGLIGMTKHVTDTGSNSPGNNNLAAGTYYGTGVRAKVGQVRTGTGIDANPVPPKKLRIPPRSVV